MLTAAALAAFLAAFGGAISFGGDAANLGNYFHDHPIGRLASGSPEWKAACKNAFKSFNADDGTWKDKHGVYHACVIKIVHKL